jgi:hypothetical protein
MNCYLRNVNQLLYGTKKLYSWIEWRPKFHIRTKTDFIKKKRMYILLIHWKAGSFNLIIFQFYSQTFFQHFLSTSEVGCSNNTLLKSCQERPSLPIYFLITLTSYTTGSRSRNIDWNLNYGEHISCSNYAKYGRVYISASIIKLYL